MASIESKLSNIRKITNSSLNSIVDITNLNFKDLSEANLLFLDNIGYNETSNSIDSLDSINSDFVSINNQFTMNLNGVTTWSIDSNGRAVGQSIVVEVSEAKRARHSDFPNWPDEGIPGEIIYTGIQNQRVEFGEDFIGYLDGRGWVSLTGNNPQPGIFILQEQGSPGIPDTPDPDSGLLWIGTPGLSTTTTPTTQELYFTDENGDIFSVILGAGAGPDSDWNITGVDLKLGVTGDVLPNITGTNNLGIYVNRWNAVHSDGLFLGSTPGMAIYKDGDTLEILSDNVGAGTVHIDAADDIDIEFGNQATIGDTLTITNSGLRYADGNEALGYVLTSDGLGNASWQPSTGGGGGGANVAFTTIVNLTAGVPLTVNHGLNSEYIQVSGVQMPAEVEVDLNVSGHTANTVDITSTTNAQIRLTILSAGSVEAISDEDWVIIGSPGTDLQMGVPGNVLPYADDQNDLGSSSLRFKDLYLGSVVDFLTNLEFKRNGESVVDINQNEISIKSGKTLDIETDTPSFGTLATTSYTGPDSLYAYILKVGQRIFISDYWNELYEYDEDLNLINTYDISDLPDGAYYLQYNETLNRIYIGDWNGGSGARYLDLSSPETIVSVNTGITAQRDTITYDSYNDLIYSYDYGTDSIITYDSDYIYVESTSVPAGFNGYGITSNSQNGKVYVQGTGLSGSDIHVYEQASPGLTLVATLNYPTLSTFNSFGSAYDEDRNVAYIGVDYIIAVIDGDTNAEITQIDLTTYGAAQIHSVSYSNNTIIVTLDDNLLSINPDTYAVTVIKNGDNNYYSFGIYDGSHYYANIDTDTIDKIDGAETFSVAKLDNNSGATSDTTHSLQPKSGTLAHLDDILEVQTGKTIWVDQTYGDNVTAEPYNANKPYASIGQARSNAAAGDLIWIRPGNYVETVQLIPDVSYWADKGVTVRKVQASGYIVPIVSSFLGHAEIVTTGGNAVAFSVWDGSDCYVEADYIEAPGGETLRFDTDAGFQTRLRVKSRGDIINTNTGTARLITWRTDNNTAAFDYPWEVECEGTMRAKTFHGYGSNGRVDFIIKGNYEANAPDGNGVWISEANSKCKWIGNITNNQTFTISPTWINCLIANRASGATFEFTGELKAKDVPCVSIYNAGTIKVTDSYLYSEDIAPLKGVPGQNGGKVLIQNSTIKDGPGNTESYLLSHEVGYTGTTIIKDSFMIKDDTLSPTGGVLYKENTNGVSVINSSIICGASQDITETDSATNGEFYFKGTDSNKGLGTNTVNVGADLYENNSNINYIEI